MKRAPAMQRRVAAQAAALSFVDGDDPWVIPEFLKLSKAERDASWERVPPTPSFRFKREERVMSPDTVAFLAERDAKVKAKSVHKREREKASPKDPALWEWNSRYNEWRPRFKLTPPKVITSEVLARRKKRRKP